MAVLCVRGVLCVLGTALVILPHVNMGLLSDYKICGDAACESMISSAQAIRDHQGKDCRFLSFRRGDTIFVYHKLTGKREDLWAGSIDKQFGYFPKDAVQEEQVYAAMEKVVETRKSDFFCMDEFGYPIDSTHLDSDDDDDAADDESDKEIQIHKSEFTQTTTHTESSLESAGPAPTESIVSAQEAGGNEEKNNADPAEDTQNMAALDEQGGSPSSAWLSSSVTGWLGLTKEELPDHSPEEQKEKDNKDTQAEDSLASSVTSWLTLGREGKPGNTKESVETGEENADSVTSSIGGWLGFGREKKADSANEEKEEPVEKFRSRRISLDLEGSQLHAEEEKDTGTFGWLRHGLTSTLGFDSSNKESSDDTSPEETEKDEKEPPSSAWLEIGGILDVKKDNNGDENDHTENSLKEKRNDEDTAGLENVVTSQSQPALTDDEKTDKRNLEESPKDQNAHSNVQNGDEEIKEDESFEKEQNKNNEVTSVETKDEDHEQSNETMEQKQQEIQIPIGSNQDSTTQADIYGPNHTFRSSIDEGKAEDEKNPVSVETGSDDDDDHEEAGSNEEAALSHKEILSTQIEDSADESQISSEQSRLSPFFSSDKSSDPVQAVNSSFTSHGEASNEDDTNTEAVTDINVETETGYNGLAQKKETPSTEGSAQEFTLVNFTRGDTESLVENSSEEEKRQIPLDGSTPNTKSDIEGGNDASDGGKQELTKEEGNRKLEDSIKVEEIKEEVNQEEEEQLEDEARSDKPDDSREAEEIKEVEKQDKVEESVNEDGNVKLEDLMMVEEIKKEKIEKVKVLESGEENDQLQDLKEAEDIKEERQEVEGLDINEKRQGRGDVNEETALEEIKEKEMKGEDKNIKEQIIMFNPNEEDKDKDVGERTQKNEDVELTESNGEKIVGETELVKEQEKADEEALKEVDGLKELAKEETGEKQLQSSQFEVQNNPGDSSTPAPDSGEENIQDESVMSSFAESSTKTESPQSEEKWEDEDKKREEVAELEQAEEQHVEGDNLKCSKELCTEGSAEEFVVEEGSTEDGGISVSEEMTEKQSNQTNRTSERELIRSDGETEQTRGLGTMEGKVEEEIREEVNQEVEKEQSEDEERSDKPDGSREVEEKVERQDKVEELVDEEDLTMVEVIKNEKPEEVKGVEENEQLEDLKEIKEERQQEVGGLDESKKLHERDGVKEETVVVEIKEKENKEEDKTVTEQNIEEEKKDLSKNERSDSWSKEKQEISASTGDLEQSASLGSSLTADDHNRGAADSETAGAFGLFKNAFGFFSQTPTTESVDSTEQAQPPNLDVIDPSELQSSLTHKEDLDSIGEASQTQDESPESSGELPPSSTDLHTPSPNPEAPQQTKTLSKHYKNLLAHVDAKEMTILLDLFGQHKLQFLDYTLSSPKAEDPDGDQSIVSDIERLLEHHREKLFAPSMRIAEAPREDKERTRTLVTLQKLEAMLESVRKSFQSDVSIHQAEVSCVDTSCFTGEELRKIHDPSGNVDNVMHKDEFAFTDGDCGQETECVEDKTEANRADIDSQSQRLQEGGMSQVLDFIRQMAGDSVTYSRALMERFTQVVSALPDDIRPGPDLYGVPWEPVIFTAVVGLVTVLVFTCRCYSSVKSRMYRSREQWMAQQVAQLLNEKCKVLETLSQHQQEYDDLENSLKDSGVLAQSQKTEQLEATAEHLAHAKRELESDLQQLKGQLDQQRESRTEQEKQIAALEGSMETLEGEIKDLQSQDEQAQTTVKVYNMNSDRLERNLDTAGEENALLQESNAQLKQQVEGWAERVSELEAEMRRCEVAHSGMLQDVANKDERIKSLTDRLLSMKAWNSDLEEEETETANSTAGKGDVTESGDATDTQRHRQKVQKLIYAAKLNADLKSVDEDKDRVFAKLNDEVKAKEDLQVAMKELENEKLSLQSGTEHYSEQVQRLQQKLHIMTEMYQENELKLHRLLTVEEKERLQKEEKLNKADKNIAMAMEELNNYRQRAREMEEELEKTKQSYQTQISAHEKKAHNNWLAARAADRDLTDIRRENAIFRQKLTDTQFKLDALDQDPYALDSLARPLPFRGERSPYGPSPLGRPASETRPFLSPPTLMEGPPPRLSPRVPRGPGEPPGGQGEMERSGGPHSDSGSISPTWDRRGPPPGPPGPLGPPGYMFRRPPPHPGAMGLLPPPGPLHPRGFPPGPPHPADLMDGPYRENSLGAAEQEHREQSGPGERKTPPESDPRMGGPPPPGPPMGPMDGPFPRRGPYGPPPPSDFYPSRGPGGPPIMPTWAPPPPGMMLRPRFPPHPHVPPFNTPMRQPPPPDGFPPHPMELPPPRQPLPPPLDNPTSPEDAI